MTKVLKITLHDPKVDFPRKTTNYDPHGGLIPTIFVVNKYTHCLDGYTNEQFIEVLNEGEFQENSRVVAHNGSDYVFFDDKAKALVFLKECHDKLLEDEESSKEDYLQDDDDYEDGIL